MPPSEIILEPGTTRVADPDADAAISGSAGARGERPPGPDIARVVAEVAHDLRSPLTAVVGNAQLLRSVLGGGASAEVRDLLDALCASASRAVDFSRDLMVAVGGGGLAGGGGHDAGDVLRVVRACCDDWRSRARARRLRLDCDIGPGEAARGLRTDRIALARIVDNLVGNAVRYTEEGRIHVAARVTDGRLVVTVADSGPGIESERIPTLFEPFVRGADSIGHGLGLSIARRLVESLGGHIAVSSAPGAGSCFRFSLPLERA